MSLYSNWLNKIRENQNQWEAFQKVDHTVVIAGPGSGKTRVLAVKIAQLLREEIPAPRGIACLTYTRMMARELENRLSSLGVLDRSNVVVGTVHSFCLAHVVNPFAGVFDLNIPQPIKIAPKKNWDYCLDQARKQVTNRGYNPDDDTKFRTDITKYHLQRTDIPLEDWENQEYAQILQSHYHLLREQGYVDFDLIVRLALNLIATHDLVRQSLYAKFAWIAVDEYQDLGYPLFKIVTEMMRHTPIKVFVIGDPDQCIFDFAGTDPKYLIELAKKPEIQPVIKLTRNYRTTSGITTVSKAILTPYCDYESEKEGGACRIYEVPPHKQNIYITQLVQKYLGHGFSQKDIAILHPRRKGINEIAEALRVENIGFSLDKNPNYDRSLTLIKWLEDLGCLCLNFFEPGAEVNNITAFNELLLTWSRIMQPQGLWDTNNGTVRLQLIKLIWSIKGRDMRLGEWISYVRSQMSFHSSLEEYNKIFPDEVEELNRLQQITQQCNVLGERMLSDFVNFTRGIQLTTLHSSKGMEFKVVIIAGVEKIRDDENGNRLLYVGVTRAEQEICLVYSKFSYGYEPQKRPVCMKNLIRKCNHLEYVSHHILR
jgi:DNA helicase II / ATP-dependent DNA helicase PcrA